MIRKSFSSLPKGMKILWVLAIAGAAVMVYRFIFGIGAVTNLSDGYPWGWWIGFDILAGIALASGGFVLAGTVHLFGREKYHPLVRAAILTALLGYLLFIFGLFIDLGRPWNLWRAIYSWHHESPMFEVAWCVMLYTTVLILEFAPMVFERYGLKKLHDLWNRLVPWVIIFMVSMFTLAMTYSFVWMGIVFVILLAWELTMIAGIMPRDKQMPVLLIMAGVIFSTMHQSSLGSIFLLSEQFIHPLWYTPILPLLFLFSAIMVAPAMVTFESLTSERYLKHTARLDLLTSLSRWMPYLLVIYLIAKIADIVVRGAVTHTLTYNTQSVSWWLEMIIGVIIPLALYLSPDIRSSRRGLYWASSLVVIGLIWNRLNVSIVGMMVPEWESYFPLWSEVFITIGIFSIGLIAFRWAMDNLPIIEHHEATTT
jgi:Ni/Fe-hydrogenase subunit HybB-like protein